MKVGIISDTHDCQENIKKAVGIFKEKKVAYIVHLGDFVNPHSVELFQGTNLQAVFGNNDGDRFRLTKTFESLGAKLHGDFAAIEEDGLKIALYHGTEKALTESLIRSGSYNVVLYGHTHKKDHRKVGGTLVINPGTAHGFGEQATVAIFDTTTQDVVFIEL